ncbi:MAG: GTP cyclohydrolase II [Alphaproteobacteria bacterium]|nr:GTP cyclohydrolase II [Alphaproteobacteria bacterium]
MPAPAPAVRLSRAAAELRAGRAVVLHDGEGTALVHAAEAVSEGDLAGLRQRGQPLLVLPLRRAAVLRVLPGEGDAVAIVIEPRADAALIRGLADATTDLDQPLRGPFRRIKQRQPPRIQAALQLCKRAGLLPAAVLVDGAADDGALSVTADEVDGGAPALRQVATAKLPLAEAENTSIVAFRPDDGGPEQLALLIGEVAVSRPVLTRLHSSCLTGDVLGSLKCDCGPQLRGAVAAIAQAGGGVLLYLAQEGRGIGLVNKLRAYALQDQGFDTVEANLRLGFEADERDFAIAATMLRTLGIGQVRLMTNNPEKVAALAAEGIAVTERVPHAFPPNVHNERYLATKRRKSGHYL